MKKNYLIVFILILSHLLLASQVFAVNYKIEIPLPGVPANSSFSDPGQYVKYLFIFGLSLAAFLAVGAITFGGIKYMLAGASIGSVQQAKDLIIGAITGIVLLLVSYLLLATIDPTLTNLSPQALEPIDIPALVAEFDINTQGMSADQIRQLVTQGKITGQNSSISCSIDNCGAQTVQGHQLASGAADKYSKVQMSIKEACAAQGLVCDAQLTSTVDGEHASSCHKPGNAKSGTCGDFVITATECGGGIKLCSPAIKEKYLQVASAALSGSSNISSCLNEYKVQGSSYTTGGHFHCNF